MAATAPAPYLSVRVYLTTLLHVQLSCNTLSRATHITICAITVTMTSGFCRSVQVFCSHCSQVKMQPFSIASDGWWADWQSPQSNQEPLVHKTRLKAAGELGGASPWNVIRFLQCSDTVGSVTGRASDLQKVRSWYVGGDNLTGAFCVLQLQQSPPPTTSIAPIKSRTET